MCRYAALVLFLVAALAVMGPAIGRGGEKEKMVENPAFKNWSAFKEGTTVKLKETVIDKSGDAPGVIDATARPDYPSVRYITYKLMSRSPDKVVLQQVQTEIEAGNETEHAPVKITYFAKYPAKYAQESLAKDKVGNFKEGDEELTVAGKKFKAHWVESDIKVGTEESIGKIWYADGVPGGTIKRVTSKKEAGKVLFDTTITVVGLTIN